MNMFDEGVNVSPVKFASVTEDITVPLSKIATPFSLSFWKQMEHIITWEWSFVGKFIEVYS